MANDTASNASSSNSSPKRKSRASTTRKQAYAKRRRTAGLRKRLRALARDLRRVALVIDLDPSDARSVRQCSKRLMEISRTLDGYAEVDFEKRGKA